ncbi:MAG: hypothetical protein CM15mP88_3140 [Pseudomonadota bacterium]|nr:MAG: hypothetical protein CM15mP88_3140 [Pseudomonadota bacterium]
MQILKKSIVESCLMFLEQMGKKVKLPWFYKKEDDFLKKIYWKWGIVNAANLATECKKWNIPFWLRVFPFGWPKADNRNPKIKSCARVASELGERLCKNILYWCKNSFRKSCKKTFFGTSFIFKGGPKIDSDLEVLQMVRDALDAGFGITMGRKYLGPPRGVFGRVKQP